MIENWKEVTEFPGYEVSDQGRVRSVDRRVRHVSKCGTESTRLILSKVLKPLRHTGGYRGVSLWVEGNDVRVFIHKLVLLAFVGPRPEGKQACHRDGDKTNNRIDNLRWDTAAANQADRILHGTRYGRPGSKGQRKVTPEIVSQIRRVQQANISALARELQLPRTTVADVVNRRTYARI